MNGTIFIILFIFILLNAEMIGIQVKLRKLQDEIRDIKNKENKCENSR